MINYRLTFPFQTVTREQISKQINNKKSVIKEFYDFFSESLYNTVNHFFNKENFIADFKKAEVRSL